MGTNNWHKFTFQIESNTEEIIIWKLNDLGISSYAFESILNIEGKKNVLIWLPVLNWSKSKRLKFEREIIELLEKNNYEYCCFNWSIIKQEDWISSWKKYWGPELVGNQLLILPYWLKLPKKYKKKKLSKLIQEQLLVPVAILRPLFA